MYHPQSSRASQQYLRALLLLIASIQLYGVPYGAMSEEVLLLPRGSACEWYVPTVSLLSPSTPDTPKNTLIESIESTVGLEKCPRLCHPRPRMWNRSHPELNGRPGRPIRHRGLGRPRLVRWRAEILKRQRQGDHQTENSRVFPRSPAELTPNQPSIMRKPRPETRTPQPLLAQTLPIADCISDHGSRITHYVAGDN